MFIENRTKDEECEWEMGMGMEKGPWTLILLVLQFHKEMLIWIKWVLYASAILSSFTTIYDAFRILLL
jgi:hypothetical protein